MRANQILSDIIKIQKLWIRVVTLIHKPITGLSPFDHPLGHMPALASLGGHIVYGMVLGTIVLAYNFI